MSRKKEQMENRIREEAKCMINTNCTVRDLSKMFGVSKSTAHKDLAERLKYVDYMTFNTIREILDYHAEIKHINGGEATKRKYETA